MSEREKAQLTLPIDFFIKPLDRSIPKGGRIYCNHNLRFDQVAMVGFDLESSIPIFKRTEIDRLGFELAISKLVQLGYDSSIKEIKVPSDLVTRGLWVDKKHGNILKIDRARCVQKALHGRRILDDKELRNLYRTKRIRPSTKRYCSADGQFSPWTLLLFIGMIDHLGIEGSSLTYLKLFEDIERCVSELQQEGCIEKKIAGEPDRFLIHDADLVMMLEKIRTSGLKTFLLTNSNLEIADAIMAYTLYDSTGGTKNWRQYFDVIVTDADKPRFFTEHRSFYFTNSNGEVQEVEDIGISCLYQQGSCSELERITGTAGHRIVYLSDHIISQLLHDKGNKSWRTLVMIPELQRELDAIDFHTEDLKRLEWLNRHHYSLQKDLDEYRSLFRSLSDQIDQIDNRGGERVELEASRLRLRRRMERITSQSRTIKAEIVQIKQHIDKEFHHIWGSCFKAGFELSSFGDHIERHACLYTSRASNLSFYSAKHHFRRPAYLMVHENEAGLKG